MNPIVLLNRAGVCIVAMLIAASSQADELHSDRRQASHVHGSAALNIVAEGVVIHIELISPSANLVGFEHAPASEAEHTARKNALSTLRNADRLFRFNKTANCLAGQVQIGPGSTSPAQSTGQEAHRQDGADGHEYADTRHSDITAIYLFTCDLPGKLDTLHVGLFDAFPAIDNLTVQYITDGRQGSATLNSSEPALTF